MTELEAKLAVHQAAAMLTAGVVSNLPDTINLDPEIKDPAVQAQNLMAWQLHKVFYHALCGALAGDAASWPTPPADKMAAPAGGTRLDGSVISALVNGAIQMGGPALLQALTPEARAVLQALIAKIPPPPAMPAPPLTP